MWNVYRISHYKWDHFVLLPKLKKTEQKYVYIKLNDLSRTIVSVIVIRKSYLR